MKYIVTGYTDDAGELIEELFMFPDAINHSDMMESLRRIKHTEGRSWLRVYRNAISAGFTDGKKCWGRSETLNLDSRMSRDTALLVQ